MKSAIAEMQKKNEIAMKLPGRKSLCPSQSAGEEPEKAT